MNLNKGDRVVITANHRHAGRQGKTIWVSDNGKWLTACLDDPLPNGSFNLLLKRDEVDLLPATLQPLQAGVGA